MYIWYIVRSTLGEGCTLLLLSLMTYRPDYGIPLTAESVSSSLTEVSSARGGAGWNLV